MIPVNARIVPSTLESDIRELHKWLNEQPNRPVDRPALARVVYYARTASEPDAWQPIETAPHNKAVILANFTAACLLSAAPHVWTATYATKWMTLDGESVERPPMWLESSYASENYNGDATHWMPLPKEPTK